LGFPERNCSNERKRNEISDRPTTDEGLIPGGFDIRKRFDTDEGFDTNEIRTDEGFD
jgi:hypothetical protein